MRRVCKNHFLICTLLILLFATPCAFAKNVFSFSVGANISYLNGAFLSKEQDSGDEEETKFSLDNLSIGLESRMNIGPVRLTAVGDLAVVDQTNLLASGILAAGLSCDLFSVVRLGASVGPRISYLYIGYSNSSAEDSNVDTEKISNGKNFLEALESGKFNIRFTFDVIAGPVLTIGAAYVVQTDFSIASPNWEAFKPQMIAWDKGQISLCVQMLLF